MGPYFPPFSKPNILKSIILGSIDAIGIVTNINNFSMNRNNNVNVNRETMEFMVKWKMSGTPRNISPQITRFHLKIPSFWPLVFFMNIFLKYATWLKRSEDDRCETAMRRSNDFVTFTIHITYELRMISVENTAMWKKRLFF